MMTEPDDLCSLEIIFNGRRETLMEISRKNIPVLAADPRVKIVGEPVSLGYGASKDRFCAEFGTEGD